MLIDFVYQSHKNNYMYAAYACLYLLFIFLSSKSSETRLKLTKYVKTFKCTSVLDEN